MISKIALNNVKQKGFDSKSQMRYLLMLAKTHSEYSWVFEVLREHGVPSTDKVEPAYWEAPYKVSPDTPSYSYKRKLSSSIFNKIIKIANELDSIGKHLMANKLDKWASRRVNIDFKSALDTANSYWSLRKNELSKDPEELAKWFNNLDYFESYMQQNSETREEVKRILSDKILGRT